MGIAADCAGHRLAVAWCCVTGDYIRPETASCNEPRRAGCHLHAGRTSTQANIRTNLVHHYL